MASYNNKTVQQSDLFSCYLSMNVNNICRICLEKGTKLMPIFDPIKPPHFSILIMACAAVQVLQGDGLPPYICQKCISKLNIAFQFKTQCESSDAKLRQCFDDSFQHLPSTPDLSGFLSFKKDNTTFSQNNDEGTDDFNSDKQPDIQNGNGSITEHQILQTVGIDTDTSLYEFGNSSLIELKSELDQNTNEMKVEDMIIVNTSEVKKPKKHECDTCGKNFRTKPGLVHHIRIHTGERPYQCHLCDKRFINGGHLHTHMRTHTGEKNHVCVACSKAFATAQQLTKHTIAIHTSERPYGCMYCSKRFASSSNLNTHTRIHTGEKNFHCELCGKPFSTKGQLYQHMLVHSGVRAFMLTQYFHCKRCKNTLIYSAFKELHPTIEDIYVANIESDKGTKEKVRLYDTAGIDDSSNAMTNQQLPRHYLMMADGYVLVYDSGKAGSLDVLMSIKKDIDKNKDKKEVTIIVINNTFSNGQNDPEMESNVNKAMQWCMREKIKHFNVSAFKRSTLYEPFVFLTSKLTPPPSKSSFTPLSMGRKVMKDSN